MDNWESLIASKQRDIVTCREPDPVKRNALALRRKYEKSPKRKAQHKAWQQSASGKESMRRRNKKWRESEHGREVCRQKSKRWYAAHKNDPEFMERKRIYNREYRRKKRESA